MVVPVEGSKYGNIDGSPVGISPRREYGTVLGYSYVDTDGLKLGIDEVSYLDYSGGPSVVPKDINIEYMVLPRD